MAFQRKMVSLWLLSVMLLTLGVDASDENVLSTNHVSSDRSSLQVDPATIGDEVSLKASITICSPDVQCKNGGDCILKVNQKSYCNCKNGTSGDFCEIVDECVQNPPKCGNGTDVECVYDIDKESAECSCLNTSKSFDSFVKRCRVPCTSNKDCPPYVRCRKVISDDHKFCRCPWGTGGDDCDEEVDECKAIGKDCGNDPNVTCVDRMNGEDSICHCEVGGWSVSFDYDSKECIKCNCGGSNLGCEFYPGGEKMCYCSSKYYQRDGLCQECKCGVASYGCKMENGTKVCDCWSRYIDNGGVCEDCKCGSARGCKIENGTKICDCWDGYLENGGVCEECDCGVNSNGCKFENGKKVCSCEPNYIQSNGTCKKKCSNYDDVCKYGGKCTNSVCKCLPGTSGDRCEIIQGCEDEYKRYQKCGYFATNAYCDFNVTALKPYCRCSKSKYVYDSYYKTCKACDCGYKGNCSFVGGQKTCSCEKGYAERPSSWLTESECYACNCGVWSEGCVFLSYDTKECNCDPGYSQKIDVCSECKCGPYGDCSFTNNGEKVCNCESGYAEKDGRCVRCDCGLNSECRFDDDGEKICECSEGYADKNGICTRCSCYWKGEYLNCTFTFGVKKCLCPKGYEESYLDLCKDINECLNRSACPLNTRCVNSQGSYDCLCNNGFRPFSSKHEAKRYGCMDINECVEENACRYRDTTNCINTQGSYYCSCKNGYVPKSSAIEYNGCELDQSGWKIGYIVLIVAFIIAISGLLIAIIRKRKAC